MNLIGTYSRDHFATLLVMEDGRRSSGFVGGMVDAGWQLLYRNVSSKAECVAR